ncbi:MAG: DUF3426 domain-containing protein [Pseudomonadota bacterium]
MVPGAATPAGPPRAPTPIPAPPPGFQRESTFAQASPTWRGDGVQTEQHGTPRAVAPPPGAAGPGASGRFSPPPAPDPSFTPSDSQLDWSEPATGDAFADPGFEHDNFHDDQPIGDVTAADFEPRGEFARGSPSYAREADEFVPPDTDFARQPPARRTNVVGLALGWLLLVGVVGGGAATVALQPERVTALFPGAQPVLAQLGVVPKDAATRDETPGLTADVSNAGPIQIADLDMRWEVQGRTATLRVAGRIVNRATENVPLPRLTFVLTDRDGTIRLVQTVNARDQWLAPGASSRLAIRLIPPSVELARLSIRLAPPQASETSATGSAPDGA